MYRIRRKSYDLLLMDLILKYDVFINFVNYQILYK